MKIATDFDRRKQAEIYVEADLSESNINDILQKWFSSMDYIQRKLWISINLKPNQVTALEPEIPPNPVDVILDKSSSGPTINGCGGR